MVCEPSFGDKWFIVTMAYFFYLFISAFLGGK